MGDRGRPGLLLLLDWCGPREELEEAALGKPEDMKDLADCGGALKLKPELMGV